VIYLEYKARVVAIAFDLIDDGFRRKAQLLAPGAPDDSLMSRHKVEFCFESVDSFDGDGR
jgi:hypothetical protein